MNLQEVEAWLSQNPLQPIEVDCATTVMLKILDGKCKMNAQEKMIMALLYEASHALPGQLFDAAMHRFIAHARSRLDEAMKMQVYEQRLLAETRLSRPVMKAFKAMLRQKGLLPAKLAITEED